MAGLAVIDGAVIEKEMEKSAVAVAGDRLIKG